MPTMRELRRLPLALAALLSARVAAEPKVIGVGPGRTGKVHAPGLGLARHKISK